MGNSQLFIQLPLGDPVRVQERRELGVEEEQVGEPLLQAPQCPSLMVSWRRELVVMMDLGGRAPRLRMSFTYSTKADSFFPASELQQGQSSG